MSNEGSQRQVRQISVHELKRMMDEGLQFELYDVRTQAERAIACIKGARHLDPAAVEDLEELPRDTLLVFCCHHGVRSQGAAHYFIDKGFDNVCNVTGGIDAWSQEIDPSVPRY